VPEKVHFPGLNSLRFLAAFFVVIGHIPLNQESAGLPHPSWGAFFFRGSWAVDFFFALSGFLITYLLLDERRRSGGIDVRSFYLRRVCRIWPLYFLVVFCGLFFYNVLLPRLGIPYRVEYRLGTALLLYGALLPNLMNNLYTVGGLLNPSWSIGVEEQFYLLWAPAVARLRARLPLLCWGVLGVSLAIFCLNHYDVFGLHPWKGFFGQLKFHFMAAGALCACWLARRRQALLALPPFANRSVQILLFALLVDLYVTSWVPWGWLGEELAQLVLYCWIILNVAANPANVVPVGKRAFDYLGTISYGIYMLHMVAIYAVSALYKQTGWGRGGLLPYLAGYYALAFTGTFLLAHLSYRYYERPFLRLKDLRFSPLPRPAGPAGPPSVAAGTEPGAASTGSRAPAASERSATASGARAATPGELAAAPAKPAS
jgi:peptidoglycan/LPS O-acetylase OafA/YrhL